MNKNIVFDLDGTLITCKEKQVVLFDIACNLQKITINPDYYWTFKRNGASNTSYLESLIVPQKKIEKISNFWINEIEEFQWLFFDTLHSGAIEKLEELNKNNNLYLLTARKNEFNVHKQCHDLGISVLINEIIVVSHNNVVSNKKNILKKLHADIFIGDSETDFFSTQGLNCKFFGVSNGQRNPSFLKQNGVNNITTIANLSL